MFKKLALLFTLFSGFLQTRSQHVITGKVVDAGSRQPLESAFVQEANNPIAKTITDQYGNFSLRLNEENSSLIISYIGYKPATIDVKKNQNVLATLEHDIISMKDVVVISNSNSPKFSTLGKIDLDLKPVRNTQELMRVVPGLFIAQHAGGGKAEQIFLRGFDCDHGTDVQVSVDGLPVNMVSHAHGQGYADSHFIIPETINNIDYGAGPYYTQHGNLNTAGYINFSTYNNIEKSRVQVEGGLFNTFRTLAMIDLLKKDKDKQSAYIAGDFYYTDGPTDNKQHFNRVNIFGKYNLAISDRTQLVSSLSFFKSKWNASGQIPERAVQAGLIDRFGSIDPTEGGNTERENANIVVSHRFSSNSNWENQFYFSHYIFNLYSNFTFFASDSVNGDEINQAESRNTMGYLSKFSHKNTFSSWTLNSIYGAGIRYDATDSSKLAHVVKREFLNYIKLGKIKEANAFSYIEEQASIGKWFIDAGLRFDYLHFDYLDKLGPQLPAQGKSILSPKLNIQYTLNPKLQLYIKTGKGFHSNDTRVVVANSGHEILPSAYATDLGFILKPNNRLFLNVAAWYLFLEQEFVYVGDDGNLEPSGKTRRRGIDIITRYQLTDKIFATLNLNFTDPKSIGEPKGQNYIPLAPTFTSTGGIFYRSKNGFNGGINYRYIKDRPANENNSIVAKGYLVTDASINYTRPKYEIGLAAENLFNTKWNEAQFATTSRLKGEATPVTELNFTPGIPLFLRAKLSISF
ncbi:MAG: carboxypeptidase-like regulatory domain-containing protein [Bacteroidetes bacterium]|nr:carboxypeptidase-like regulatory domain-containing protein [Bacteroidota bacterium]